MLANKYKSNVFEAIHSAAEGLYRSGGIDKASMRKYDKDCLVPRPLSPAKITQIRRAQHISQPVFATYLNTSESTVKGWESGTKKPGGIARKLLTLVDKHGLEILG